MCNKMRFYGRYCYEKISVGANYAILKDEDSLTALDFAQGSGLIMTASLLLECADG